MGIVQMGIQLGRVDQGELSTWKLTGGVVKELSCFPTEIYEIWKYMSL